MKHKMTQKEFDVLEIINGVKNCPANTDYSLISSFGEGCRFGEAKYEAIGSTIYYAGGFGSCNRTTYGIPTKDGVFVRCGCWSGWLSEFRNRIHSVYDGYDIEAEYMIIANLFEARWMRQMEALDLEVEAKKIVEGEK